jgi:hypothetical protein
LTLPLFKDIPVREERTRFKSLRYKSEYHKRWKQEHPERTKQMARKDHIRLKKEILTHYSLEKVPKCACCGEMNIEFLSIDHIYGGGKKHYEEIGGLGSLYGWLKRNNYPEGFRVLCMNCNFSLGHFGYCPHQEIKKEGTEQSVLNINLTSNLKET